MSKEQGRYIVVDDESMIASDGMVPEVHPFDCGCAWCLRESGQEMGNGTHGICGWHAEDQYERYRASRRVA